MREQKFTYEEMISKVKGKTYTAPDRWMRIEDELKINESLQYLGTYTAPDSIWDNIDSELDQIQESDQTQTDKPSSSSIKRKYLIRLIVLVCLMSIAYLGYDRTEDTAVTYTSDVIETVQTSAVNANTVDLTEAFDFIGNNDFLYTAEEKIDYEKQLQQLDEAISEVEAMQEMYGADIRTKKMLAKIEREKAELIKKMIKGA